MTLPKRTVMRCVVCGSTKELEMNHPAGRKFVPSFSLPYCKRHHHLFHMAVNQAGIDLNCTDNPLARFVRAMKMLLVVGVINCIYCARSYSIRPTLARRYRRIYAHECREQHDELPGLCRDPVPTRLGSDAPSTAPVAEPSQRRPPPVRSRTPCT